MRGVRSVKPWLALLVAGTVAVGLTGGIAPSAVGTPYEPKVVHLGPAPASDGQRVTLAATNLSRMARRAVLSIIDCHGQTVAREQVLVPPQESRMASFEVEHGGADGTHEASLPTYRGRVEIPAGSDDRWAFTFSTGATNSPLNVPVTLLGPNEVLTGAASTGPAPVATGEVLRVPVTNLGSDDASFRALLVDGAGRVFAEELLENIAPGTTEMTTFSFSEAAVVRAVVVGPQRHPFLGTVLGALPRDLVQYATA